MGLMTYDRIMCMLRNEKVIFENFGFKHYASNIISVKNGNKPYWPFWLMARYSLIFEYGGGFELWVPEDDVQLFPIADVAYLTKMLYGDIYIRYPLIQIQESDDDEHTRSHLWDVRNRPSNRIERMLANRLFLE